MSQFSNLIMNPEATLDLLPEFEVWEGQMLIYTMSLRT